MKDQIYFKNKKMENIGKNNNKYKRSSILESKVAFSKRAKGTHKEISSEGTLKKNIVIKLPFSFIHAGEPFPVFHFH
jgi:hypothetical protein